MKLRWNWFEKNSEQFCCASSANDAINLQLHTYTHKTRKWHARSSLAAVSVRLRVSRACPMYACRLTAALSISNSIIIVAIVQCGSNAQTFIDASGCDEWQYIRGPWDGYAGHSTVLGNELRPQRVELGELCQSVELAVISGVSWSLTADPA